MGLHVQSMNSFCLKLLSLESGPESGESSLPDSILATIMSFTVHGSDTAELDRVKETSPKVRKAIDKNPSLFNRGRILEMRDHPTLSLNGIWYFAEKKSTSSAPNALFSQTRRHKTEYTFASAEGVIILVAQNHPFLSHADLIKRQYLLHLKAVAGYWQNVGDRGAAATHQLGSTLSHDDDDSALPHTTGRWYTLRQPLRLAPTREEQARSVRLHQRMANHFGQNGQVQAHSWRTAADRALSQVSALQPDVAQQIAQQVQEVHSLTKRIRLRALQAQASFQVRVLWADCPSDQGTEL